MRVTSPGTPCKSEWFTHEFQCDYCAGRFRLTEGDEQQLRPQLLRRMFGVRGFINWYLICPTEGCGNKVYLDGVLP